MNKKDLNTEIEELFTAKAVVRISKPQKKKSKDFISISWIFRIFFLVYEDFVE